jgi:hypothetical protein
VSALLRWPRSATSVRPTLSRAELSDSSLSTFQLRYIVSFDSDTVPLEETYEYSAMSFLIDCGCASGHVIIGQIILRLFLWMSGLSSKYVKIVEFENKRKHL